MALVFGRTAVVLFALLFVNICAKQRLVRQCSCDEFTHCKQKVSKVLPKCAEHCQHHLVSFGANFEALKRCAKNRQQQLKATFDCLEKHYPNACARGAPKMVPQRYKFGIELALIKELQNTMNEANMKTDLTAIIEIGKKFGRCTRSCIARKTGSCMESKICAYDLPSDTELVKQGKKCSIQSKFLTPEVIRELCFCMADAGIRQLRPSCEAIQLKQMLNL